MQKAINDIIDIFTSELKYGNLYNWITNSTYSIKWKVPLTNK